MLDAHEAVPQPPPWLMPVLLWLVPALAIILKPIGKPAFAVLGIYVYFLFKLPRFEGDFQLLYTLGGVCFGMAQRTMCIYCFRKIPIDFRRTTETDKEVTDEKAVSWSRLRRAFAVAISARGVGWGFQVKGIPEAPASQPRIRFVVVSFLKIGRSIFAMDMIMTYYHRVFHFGKLPIEKDLYDVSFPVAALLCHAFWLWSRFGLELWYNVCAALAVGLGTSRPEEWPAFFGDWSGSYSVRKHWSYTWHQGLRAQTQPLVDWFVHDLSSINRGTYLSNYGKVFSTFFLSGCMHAFGGYVGTHGGVTGDMRFFMSQAVAIWFEETVIKIARRAGVKGEYRYLGYLWVAWWMAFSSRPWLNDHIRHGMLVEEESRFHLAEWIYVATGLLK